MAAKLVLERVFEADFRSCSFGFRPKRSAVQALEALREFGVRGGSFVDIGDCFGSIDHAMLLRLVERRAIASSSRSAPACTWATAGIGHAPSASTGSARR